MLYERLDGKTWSAKGYGGDFDLVLRDSGRRFTWDGKRFVEAKASPKVASEVRERARALRAKLFREEKSSDPVGEAVGDLSSIARTRPAERATRLAVILMGR